MTAEISVDEFRKIDVRVGRIIEAEDFPEALKPAYKLKIDFGPHVGIKSSSAQITENYSKEELRGRLVLGVVNFAPRKIGPFWSEVLVLGVPDDNGKVVLVKTDKETPLGGRLF